MKCSNVVECALLVCVLCQPVPPSIHPSLHLYGRFLLEIFLIPCFCFFVMWCRPHTCGWCIIHAHTPTNGVQQLVHSAPTIEKRWSYVAVTLKTKCKSTTPREFPGYWWQFWTQHFSRYGTRLVEERKKEDERFWFWPFQVCLFKMVTVHCHYYCRLGQALKLLCVLLDVSICSPPMISPWKC